MRSRQLEAIAPSCQTLDDNDIFLETYESQYGTMQFSTVILPGAAAFTHRDSDSSLSPPPDSDSDSPSALPGPSSPADSSSGRLQKRRRPQPSPFQPQLPRPLTYPYRPSHSGHQRTITWSTSTYGEPGSSHGGDILRPSHHRASSSAVVSTAAAANARRREEGRSAKGRSMQVIQVEVDAIHAIRHFMRCNPDAVIPLSLIPSSFFEWEKEEAKGVDEGEEEQRSKGAGRELRAGWCLLGSCRQAREAVLRPQSLTTIAAPYSSNQLQLQLQQQQNVQPLPKNEKRLFRELYDHVRLDHFYSQPIKCENCDEKFPSNHSRRAHGDCTARAMSTAMNTAIATNATTAPNVAMSMSTGVIILDIIRPSASPPNLQGKAQKNTHEARKNPLLKSFQHLWKSIMDIFAR